MASSTNSRGIITLLLISFHKCGCCHLLTQVCRCLWVLELFKLLCFQKTWDRQQR